MAFGIADAVGAGLKVFNAPKYKLCSVCDCYKPTTHFHYRKDNKKYRTDCDSCRSAKHKKYYREQYKETAKTKSRQFRERDQRLALLSSARHSARIKKLNFNLTLEDIEIPEFCPFLGIKLTNIQGKGRVDSNASVDRIDPTKGYVKGNVQILSLRANFMKRDASQQELVTFCKNVLKIFGEV